MRACSRRSARHRPRGHRRADDARATARSPSSSIRTPRRCAWATTTPSSTSSARCRCGSQQHGQDARPHHDRRQHRRGSRLRLRGRDRRRLVSHHAVDLADGRLQGVLRALSGRSRDRRAQFRRDPGGGRAGRHRHGARRSLERRARVHADQRPGHLAHERVPRARVLRRGAVRDLRRAAGRSLHRHADPHPAGGHHALRLRLARRHAARAAVPGESGGVLLHGGAGVRSRRAAADAGVRDVGSGHRHERLDVPGPEVGRRLPARPRQGAVGGGARRASTSSTATWTATTMRLPTAPCRA